MLVTPVEHHNLDLLAGGRKTYMPGDVTDNLVSHPFEQMNPLPVCSSEI